MIKSLCTTIGIVCLLSLFAPSVAAGWAGWLCFGGWALCMFHYFIGFLEGIRTPDDRKCTDEEYKQWRAEIEAQNPGFLPSPAENFVNWVMTGFAWVFIGLIWGFTWWLIYCALLFWSDVQYESKVIKAERNIREREAQVETQN